MDIVLSTWNHAPELFPSAEHLARAILTTIAQPDDPALGAALDEHGIVHILQTIETAHSGRTTREQADDQPDWARRAARRWADHDTQQVLFDRDLPERAAAAGARFLIPSDPHWPARLNDLGPRRPYGLWVLGDRPEPNTEWLNAPALSIVGARTATRYGIQVASSLPSSVPAGWVVTSGGARGIDGAAHVGALQQRVPTVVMLPCGINVAYPVNHGRLFAQVRSRGLLVSEVGPGREAGKALFFARNRLVAASAVATVVVEARSRSGSMHTADQTRRLGRQLLAVPGPITSPVSAGPNRLIADRSAAAVLDQRDLPELLTASARVSGQLA